MMGTIQPADLPGSPWGQDFIDDVLSMALWMIETNQYWVAIVMAVLVAAGVVGLILSIFGYREDEHEDDDDDD